MLASLSHADYIACMNTTEHVLDLSKYEAQLQFLQINPATRIVGSIGRMVAAQEIVGRPFLEFEDRKVARLATDGMTDIDVLGVPDEMVAHARLLGEPNVDNRAFADTDVTVAHEDDVWYLRSSEADFEERLNPELMESVRGRIDEVDIVTIPLLTHIALHNLRRRDARKDQLTTTTMNYLLHTEALRRQEIPKISTENLRPFLRLQTELRVQQLLHGDNGRHSGARHSGES